MDGEKEALFTWIGLASGLKFIEQGERRHLPAYHTRCSVMIHVPLQIFHEIAVDPKEGRGRKIGQDVVDGSNACLILDANAGTGN